MCGGKIDSTCGGKTSFATCVKFEGNVSESGKLESCDCHTVHNVLEDINTSIDELHEQVYHTGLPSCIDFETEKDKTISNLNAVKAIAEKLCEVVEFIGLDKEEDCPTCIDPCDSNTNCCDSLVFYAYNEGEVQITDTAFLDWSPVYSNLDYVIKKAGNYEVTIDVGCDEQDPGAQALIGIGVGLNPPVNDPFIQQKLTPTFNSKTFHFLLIGAKTGDIIKPKLKYGSGVVAVDGVKVIIKKV